MGEVGYKRSRSASKIDTSRAPFPRRDVRLSAAMADCRAPFISELDETLRSLLRRRASPRSWRPSLVPLPYIAVWGFPPYVLYGQRSAYFQKWTGGGNSTLIKQPSCLPTMPRRILKFFCVPLKFSENDHFCIDLHTWFFFILLHIVFSALISYCDLTSKKGDAEKWAVKIKKYTVL